MMIAFSAARFPPYTCEGFADNETLPRGLRCYTDYDAKIFCTYTRDSATEGKTCEVATQYTSAWMNYSNTCTMAPETDSCVLSYPIPYTFLSFHVMKFKLTCRGPAEEDEEVVIDGTFKPSCNIQLYKPTVGCTYSVCLVVSYEQERLDGRITYMYQVTQDNGVTWSKPKTFMYPNPLIPATFFVENLKRGVPATIKISSAYTNRPIINTHFGQFATYRWVV